MRAATPLIAVAVLSGCRLEEVADSLADTPITTTAVTVTDGATTATTGGEVLPTTSSDPVQTLTGLQETTLAADETTGAGAQTTGEPAAVDIIQVVVPDDPVKVAGPVGITAIVEHATKVTVQRADDEQTVTPMIALGADKWVGTVPVQGAADSGIYPVLVKAENDTSKDQQSAQFIVDAYASGGLGWTVLDPGETRGLSLTAASDVIEVGSTWSDGALRPSVRKRWSLDGAVLWNSETKQPWPLLKGAVEDVAVAPNGWIWIVANASEDGGPQKFYIGHLDPEGNLQWPYLGLPGEVMYGVDARADNGCIAVGSAPNGADSDVLMWFVSADHKANVKHTWEYVPKLQVPEQFHEVAEGVAVVGNKAIVVGRVSGRHDDFKVEMRGAVLQILLDKGEPVGEPWIAPESGELRQSAILGVAPAEMGGWVTAGYACETGCKEQWIEARGFNSSGVQEHYRREDLPGIGYDVGFDSQKRVIVAATVFKDQTMSAYVVARYWGSGAFAYERLYPGGVGSMEEGRALVVDEYDRVFYGGFILDGGPPDALVERLHP